MKQFNLIDMTQLMDRHETVSVKTQYPSAKKKKGFSQRQEIVTLQEIIIT
jgi:hypothetical protein